MIFSQRPTSAEWKLSKANTPPSRWVLRSIELLSRLESVKPPPLCAEK